VSTRSPRALLAALSCVLLASVLGGCGSDAEKKTAPLAEAVKVAGELGAKPTITFDAPLKVPETASWTAKAGSGDRVGAQAKLILQLTIADARTGKTVISTTDSGQRPLEVSLTDQIFPSVAKALAGKAAGSRVVTASTADEAYGDKGSPQIGIKGGDPIIVVSDILSTDPTSVLEGPTGAQLTPPAKSPRLLGPADELTGVDVAGLRKPKKLVVIPLREGTGPTITGPHRVSVDYLGQVWGGKAPFNNSYTDKPVTFTVGLGGVIPAWDKGLSGLKEGARVMLVCPPGTAYGSAAQPGIPARSTLVFVVDVLGVG
jgi:peptidylprolyl isomerase